MVVLLSESIRHGMERDVKRELLWAYRLRRNVVARKTTDPSESDVS